jgi:hypothetical protein
MADRDFTREAAQDDERRERWRLWNQQRVAAIHQTVTIYDVLRTNGVQLRYSEREEQFSCPFHGKDTKPSCRAYPASARGPSHVWCFVCNERWDAIKLWKKFSGRDDIKFSTLLHEIENAFGIVTPDRPAEVEYEPEEDPLFIEVQRLLLVNEHMLTAAKRAFDLVSFLKLGVVLDRLRHQVNEQLVPLAKAKDVLDQVRGKIIAKEKACPEG